MAATSPSELRILRGYEVAHSWYCQQPRQECGCQAHRLLQWFTTSKCYIWQQIWDAQPSQLEASRVRSWVTPAWLRSVHEGPVSFQHLYCQSWIPWFGWGTPGLLQLFCSTKRPHQTQTLVNWQFNAIRRRWGRANYIMYSLNANGSKVKTTSSSTGNATRAEQQKSFLWLNICYIGGCKECHTAPLELNPPNWEVS